MKYHNYFLAIIFIFFCFACNQSTVEPKVDEVRVSIVSIKPGGALKIGEKIKIVVDVENLDSAKLDYRYFINDIYIFDNFVIADTIFSYVPYLLTNKVYWKITASMYTSVDGNRIYYDAEDSIEVKPAVCEGGICIMWSDLETEEPIYTFLNTPWTGSINGDTITLLQITPGSDESKMHNTIKLLESGVEQLPKIIEVTHIERGQFANVNDTLKQGIIKLQDFDKNGIVSGILLSGLKRDEYDFYPYKRVFWFDFSL